MTNVGEPGFGARIGRSPYAAAQLIAVAQDLYHRHPQLWGRVQAGEAVVAARADRWMPGRSRTDIARPCS